MAKRVRTDDKYVVCPFYQSRRVNSISCNGFCWPHSTIVQIYDHTGDLRTQLDVFCCGDYKKCELYRAIREARFQGELDEEL